MPNSVLLASAMTGRPGQGGSSQIDIDAGREGVQLPFEVIRRVVWDAPKKELRGLEQLWLYARGVVLSPGDFLPRHINVKWGRSDVARAWLKLDAVRERPRSSGLHTIATPEEVPA
ncbi:MAG: hypothetical protein F4Z31_01515 [Gemmatimonadetes bacterium]|nr:hypothetical protein [Gemmatimonadota bacterium]